jgi:hypothetical protein
MAPAYPRLLVHPLGPLFRHLPLELRRHLLYVNAHRRWGNFSSPTSFTEKMQWRIINDRREILTLACDKLRSKQYVQEQWDKAGLGERYKIPVTYWCGTDLNELRNTLDNIPHRFVLKPNSSSGRYLLLDTEAEAIPSNLLVELHREWLGPDEETEVFGHHGYVGAKRCLIVEQRIGIGDTAPVDIRIFTNDGEVIGSACTGRNPDGAYWSATFDERFERKPSGYSGQVPLDYPTPLSDLTQSELDVLREAARVATREFDQVRIDLYRDGDTYYFGEFTAYSSSGLMGYNTETDYRYGAKWRLPSTKD